MSELFVKQLWNVRPNAEPERTTITVESVERRYGTGRGYCVTADSAKEARTIVWRYNMQANHDVQNCDRVQKVEHRGVVVLMGAPWW